MIRAAIYARYSSEHQNEASIEDQVRICSRLIEGFGWQVTEIFSDRGISGATTQRPGYQRLLAAAYSKCFDVIVSEGLDRLSRDPEATAALYKRMCFHNVKIITHAEGEIAELHIGMKGTMNALFLKDLALKTHRGLEGRVRMGKSGGGIAFGYKAKRAESPDTGGSTGDREIVDTEANVVRRIFSEFASGSSPRSIARGLNEQGIPGPRGRTWRETTIRGHATRRTGILRNDLYIGRLVWNKQCYVRNPETGKRVARVRAESDRVVVAVPHLRIVDQDLWDRVQAKLSDIRVSPSSLRIRQSAFWLQRRPRHLLTGLMFCGQCNGPMTATGKDYMACAAARRSAGCSNRKSIRRIHVEHAVLEGLRDKLMEPELVAEFVSALNDELNRNSANFEPVRKTTMAKAAVVKKQLRGLYDAIADGLRTPGLQERLLQLEKRQSELLDELGARPEPAPRMHPKLADFYRAQVSDLHASLNKPEVRVEAASILRELVERVAVVTTNHGHTIQLTGDIVKCLKLGGETIPASLESSVKVVAGAGFEPTTFRL